MMLRTDSEVCVGQKLVAPLLALDLRGGFMTAKQCGQGPEK